MSKLNSPTTSQHDLLSEISETYAPLTGSSAGDSTELNLESRHVMVIDDEPINIKLVRKVLQDVGFIRFSDVTDPQQALAKIRAEAPDIILLDIMMPHVSGLEILEAVRATSQFKHVPIIILTASSDRKTQLEALELGATDFLTKPVDRLELIPRVRNALTMKAYHDQVRDHALRLEQIVKQRTQEVEDSRLEVVQCLARAAEFHDDITGQHTLRVGRYAGLIARELWLSDHESRLIELAAQLHDVGKLGIPDFVLQKSDNLTASEFSIMQRHCSLGKQVLEKTNERGNGSEVPEVGTPLMKLAARIAQTHHEHWDGSGYPMGLSGEEIPLEGRITAVADVFDTLSCRRPDKPPLPVQRCFDILENGRGTQFDPAVLDAFTRRRDEVIAIHVDLADVEQGAVAVDHRNDAMCQGVDA